MMPQQPPTPRSSRAAPARQSTAWCVGVVALIALPLLYIASHWLKIQSLHSLHKPEDWGHAFIVPLIAGYAVWRQRDALRRLPAGSYWPGLLPLALGLACYQFFTLGFINHMFQGFSLVMTLFGVVLLALGPTVAQRLAFPIGYLALGVTISEQVMNKATFGLQRLAAEGANALLTIGGYISGSFQVKNIGNTLRIFTNAGNEIPLNVAEACSGMRMVVAFVALGVAVAFLSCTRWWERITLLLLAAPIALLVNVVRVATLGFVSLISPDLASGDAHSLIGTLLLVPALGVFMGVVWAMRRVIEPAPDSPVASAVAAGPSR